MLKKKMLKIKADCEMGVKTQVKAEKSGEKPGTDKNKGHFA
jgi:hypothetical protein